MAIHLSGGGRGTSIEPRIAPAELTIRGDAMAVFELATGMTEPGDVLASGRVRLEGDRRLMALVPSFFDTRGPGGRGAGSASGPAGPPALRKHRERGGRSE